jgi:hypothetical protein
MYRVHEPHHNTLYKNLTTTYCIRHTVPTKRRNKRKSKHAELSTLKRERASVRAHERERAHVRVCECERVCVREKVF